MMMATAQVAPMGPGWPPIMRSSRRGHVVAEERFEAGPGAAGAFLAGGVGEEADGGGLEGEGVGVLDVGGFEVAFLHIGVEREGRRGRPWQDRR